MDASRGESKQGVDSLGLLLVGVFVSGSEVGAGGGGAFSARRRAGRRDWRGMIDR